MPEQIKGFTHVEYLMVFNAIIFAYVGAEYFLGWGSMIRYRKNYKIYLPHLLWTIFAFLLIIQNWYGIWPRVKYIDLNFFYFFYSLLPILLFHFISVIMFPVVSPGTYVDLEEHFKKNAKWLFGLFAGYFLLTILNSVVYIDKGNVLVQNMIRLGGVLLSLLAAIYAHKKWVQVSFLIIAYIALSIFIWAIPE